MNQTTSIGVTGEKATIGPSVNVILDVVIGTDGHVWKAIAENAPTDLIRSAAAGAVGSWIYRPLEIDGEIVRVATKVAVTIEIRP